MVDNWSDLGCTRHIPTFAPWRLVTESDQAMHHAPSAPSVPSAQTDHQAEGAGAAGIISNVHGGAEFVEFETVKDYKFATFWN